MPVKSAARQVCVVPHTHWDREWYDPFQRFRMRLVDAMDSLLAILASDPSFRCFLLDGQMAMVEDYLEVRPGAREQISAMAAAGRLTMGPWYVLMDEFLVSGETIIRNLQLGMRRAGAFGGPMKIGYLPDMFGHIAQMPQILAQAGITRAAVWRGVPRQVTSTRFTWEAPDGSQVLATYLLTRGYSSGADLPEGPTAFGDYLDSYAVEIGRFLGEDEAMLLMNGTDHRPPAGWLGHTVSALNAEQDRYQIAIVSLPEALDIVDESLDKRGSRQTSLWRGELRSGARANLLMGVASNRVDVKRLAARAERHLEKLAEPLCALYLPPEHWPERLLELAWQRSVLNAAHDSICACSADDVVEQVMDRHREALHIARGLEEKALASFASSLAGSGPAILNPAQRDRSGMIELVIPAGPLPPGTQPLDSRQKLPEDLTLDADTLTSLLGSIQSTRLDASTSVRSVTVTDEPDRILIEVALGNEPGDGIDLEATKAGILSRIEKRPGIPVAVRLYTAGSLSVLAFATGVPGFGWSAWKPEVPEHPVTAIHTGSSPTGSPASGPRGPGLTNGLATIVVDPADGTFSLNGHAGLGRLVDGGDAGDTYNYSPPAGDLVIDAPEHVDVIPEEAGPIRGRIVVRATYHWPERIEPSTQRRSGEQPVEVLTTYELRAGEDFVRATVELDNPCRDHRLRLHFPLPEPADTSRAECAFAVVERGLLAEGGPHELPLPTWPSRRFVMAGGLAVAHEGLCEYELVRDEEARRGEPGPYMAAAQDPGAAQSPGAAKPSAAAQDSGATRPSGDDGSPQPPAADALTITLLRATGMLSGVGMRYRPMPAGPTDPLVGSQMLGHVAGRYAIWAGEGTCDPYALVDDAFLPLRVVYGRGEGTRRDSGQALKVVGAVVSSVRRAGSELEVRLFNASDKPGEAVLPGATGWRVDLTGHPLEPFSERLPLGPWRIATLLLRESAGGP